MTLSSSSPPRARPRGKRAVNTEAQILTAAEVCELLRISSRTLKRLKARKKNAIPYLVIGGQVRYSRAQVLAYVGLEERSS